MTPGSRIDRVAFPTVAKYLDALPHGLDSYPECIAKGSFLQTALKDRPPSFARGALPEPVESLLRSPPPVNAWISEAWFNTAMFALRDIHFPGHTGREGFRRWTYDLAASLFRTPLYRALFLVVSPTRLLKGFQSRWHTFHRGVDLTLIETGPERMRFRLIYPDFLYGGLGVVGISTSLEAAVEAAGGRETEVTITRISDGATDLGISWQ